MSASSGRWAVRVFSVPDPDALPVARDFTDLRARQADAVEDGGRCGLGWFGGRHGSSLT